MPLQRLPAATLIAKSGTVMLAIKIVPAIAVPNFGGLPHEKVREVFTLRTAGKYLHLDVMETYPPTYPEDLGGHSYAVVHESFRSQMPTDSNRHSTCVEVGCSTHRQLMCTNYRYMKTGGRTRL